MIGHTDTHLSHPHRIIADSGASAHFTPRPEFIRNPRPLDPPLQIQGALGEVVMATQQGDGRIPLGQHMLEVDNIILCESLRDTLLSVVALQKVGHRVNLDASAGVFEANGSTFHVPLSYAKGILTFNIEESGTEEWWQLSWRPPRYSRGQRDYSSSSTARIHRTHN